MPTAVKHPAAQHHNDDRLYLVAYDIADPKRLRRVFKIMNGYGDWLQLSVFQCRLTRRRRMELQAAIEEVIHHGQDHVVIIDIGPADSVAPKMVSLGKTVTVVDRQPVII